MTKELQRSPKASKESYTRKRYLRVYFLFPKDLKTKLIPKNEEIHDLWQLEKASNIKKMSNEVRKPSNEICNFYGL